MAVCPKAVCISTVGVRKDLFKRDPYKVPITDFFGSVRPVEITLTGMDIDIPLVIKGNRFVFIFLSKCKF